MYDEAGHPASVTHCEHRLLRAEAEAGFKDREMLVGIHFDHGAGGAEEDFGFGIFSAKDRTGEKAERTPPDED